MYRIVNGRGTGKTLQLMLLAKETGGAIACMNPSAMQQKAYAYGLTGIDFISYSDLFNHNYDNEKVLIDEELEAEEKVKKLIMKCNARGGNDNISIAYLTRNGE